VDSQESCEWSWAFTAFARRLPASLLPRPRFGLVEFVCSPPSFRVRLLAKASTSMLAVAETSHTHQISRIFARRGLAQADVPVTYQISTSMLAVAEASRRSTSMLAVMGFQSACLHLGLRQYSLLYSRSALASILTEISGNNFTWVCILAACRLYRRLAWQHTHNPARRRRGKGLKVAELSNHWNDVAEGCVHWLLAAGPFAVGGVCGLCGRGPQRLRRRGAGQVRFTPGLHLPYTCFTPSSLWTSTTAASRRHRRAGQTDVDKRRGAGQVLSPLPGCIHSSVCGFLQSLSPLPGCPKRISRVRKHIVITDIVITDVITDMVYGSDGRGPVPAK
jgi:hypothetical protein